MWAPCFIISRVPSYRYNNVGHVAVLSNDFQPANGLGVPHNVFEVNGSILLYPRQLKAVFFVGGSIFLDSGCLALRDRITQTEISGD